jgi:hypothetical protein
MLIAGCDKDNYRELKDELYPFTTEDLANMKPYHAMNYVKCRDGYSRFITKLPGKVEERIKRNNGRGTFIVSNEGTYNGEGNEHERL